MDDRELVRSIVGGHPENFRILVHRYKRLVSHIIYRLVPDPGEKEDVGQEIFIKIYQALPGFEFRSSLATWISKISYNHCVNHLRKKKLSGQSGAVSDDRKRDFGNSGTAGGIETAPASGGRPDEALIQNEISRFLSDAINALPAKFRTIITFYYLDNMSHLEIADIMDIPVGSVKGYLFRARKLLKDRLLSNYDMEDICL